MVATSRALDTEMARVAGSLLFMKGSDWECEIALGTIVLELGILAEALENSTYIAKLWQNCGIDGLFHREGWKGKEINYLLLYEKSLGLRYEWWPAE